jgi:hypothetical protein
VLCETSSDCQFLYIPAQYHTAKQKRSLLFGFAALSRRLCADDGSARELADGEASSSFRIPQTSLDLHVITSLEAPASVAHYYSRLLTTRPQFSRL